MRRTCAKLLTLLHCTRLISCGAVAAAEAVWLRLWLAQGPASWILVSKVPQTRATGACAKWRVSGAGCETTNSQLSTPKLAFYATQGNRGHSLPSARHSAVQCSAVQGKATLGELSRRLEFTLQVHSSSSSSSQQTHTSECAPPSRRRPATTHNR